MKNTKTSSLRIFTGIALVGAFFSAIYQPRLIFIPLTGLIFLQHQLQQKTVRQLKAEQSNETQQFISFQDTLRDRIRTLEDENLSISDFLHTVDSKLENSYAQIGAINQTSKQNQTSENQPILSETAELKIDVEKIKIDIARIQTSIHDRTSYLKQRIANIESPQQRLTDLEQLVDDLDQSLSSLHDRTRNLDALQHSLEFLQNEVGPLSNSIGEILEYLAVKDFKQVDDISQQLVKVVREFNYDYKLVYNRNGSRECLKKSLQNARKRLVLVCPWISSYGFDTEIERELYKLLKQRPDLRIDVGWGYAKDFQHHEGGFYDALPKLEKLSTQFPKQLFLKCLGTHEKYMVCDEQFAMLGSHNFLTSNYYRKRLSNGQEVHEREIGLRTTDPRIIQQLIQRYDDAPDLGYRSHHLRIA